MDEDYLESMLESLTERIEALEKDSHPPQPVVTAQEFDRYKQEVNRRFNECLRVSDG